MINKNMIDLIGGTPLVRLTGLADKGFTGNIWGKVEGFNPGGSIKDRIAKEMIEGAERNGDLKKGETIVEATSGNTGIGLAWIGALKGYKVILTMPETMSVERMDLLRAYGAELVLTEGSKGMSGAIAEAEKIVENTEGAYSPKQFDNPNNIQAHFKTTGPEIWNATSAALDVLVVGVGTGGTITGVGRYLKQAKPDIEIVAVEPYDSPVLSGGTPGPHKIQGIGAGFIPNILDEKVIDRIIKVKNEDALMRKRELSEGEGLLCGLSSGAAIDAAIRLSQEEGYKERNILAVLPDTGERYLSVKF